MFTIKILINLPTYPMIDTDHHILNLDHFRFKF